MSLPHFGSEIRELCLKLAPGHIHLYRFVTEWNVDRTKKLSEVSTIDLEFSLATSKPGIYRFLIQDASLKLPRVYQVQSGSELELWYYALDKSRESSIPFEEVVEITTSVGEFQCDVMESSFEIDVKEHLDKQQVMLELRGHNIEQIHARTLLLQKQLALLIKQHS